MRAHVAIRTFADVPAECLALANKLLGLGGCKPRVEDQDVLCFVENIQTFIEAVGSDPELNWIEYTILFAPGIDAVS